jgi:hypothetical protein
MSPELNLAWTLHQLAMPPRLHSESTVYDLIANVTHESGAGTTRDKENTVWRAHLRAAGGGGERGEMVHDTGSYCRGLGGLLADYG